MTLLVNEKQHALLKKLSTTMPEVILNDRRALQERVTPQIITL